MLVRNNVDMWRSNASEKMSKLLLRACSDHFLEILLCLTIFWHLSDLSLPVGSWSTKTYCEFRWGGVFLTSIVSTLAAYMQITAKVCNMAVDVSIGLTWRESVLCQDLTFAEGSQLNGHIPSNGTEDAGIWGCDQTWRMLSFFHSLASIFSTWVRIAIALSCRCMRTFKPVQGYAAAAANIVKPKSTFHSDRSVGIFRVNRG